jgi:Uma2 family endonuclease
LRPAPGGYNLPVATTVARPRVEHPRLEPWEYDGLQTEAGWCLPIEFIDGEAVVMPPIGDGASAVHLELIVALREWQKQTTDQGVLRLDVFVALPEVQRPAPDICWWSAGRRPPVVQGVVDVVPDLVVEVLSPSTRANDLGPKREIYMRSGVRELWLVDPDARTVTRVRPGASDEVLGAEAVLRSELLDRFALDLTRVF